MWTTPKLNASLKIRFLIFLVPTFIFFVDCSNKNVDNDQGKVLSDSLSIGNTCYYEPIISTLTGTIEAAMFYGAPGYGEDTINDAKENIYILRLEKPINVLVDTTNEFNIAKSNISDLQLLSSNDLENMKGKRVTLSGTLFGAQTGHHHTEVLLEITNDDKKLVIGSFKGFPPEITGTYCYYAANKKDYDNDTWVFLDGNDNSGFMKLNDVLCSFKLVKTDSVGRDKLMQYYNSDNYNVTITIDKKEQKGEVWMRTGEIIVKRKDDESAKINFYGGCGS